MSRNRLLRSLAAALGLLAGTGVCPGQTEDGDLRRQLAELRLRNEALEQSVAQANRAEKEASEQLALVRQRMQALGRNLLDGGEQTLIDAASDIAILRERLDRLEGSSMQLAGSVSDYLRQAVAADPDARLRVETAMRELDEVLGLGQKPAPDARITGSPNRANVLSIDSVSGLLVLTIGEGQGTRIGTTYRLLRGDQPYGTAIIADVRRSISGAFVETLDPGQGPVRQGDLAILETE